MASTTLKPGLNRTDAGKLHLVHTVTKAGKGKAVIDTGHGKFAVVVKGGKAALTKA